MSASRLKAGELVAVGGGALLALSVFLAWYATGNANARIDGMRGVLSAWDVHPVLRILLLLAAVAPLVLAYIILRGHTLSWPRGELTAVIGIAAVGFLLWNGLIDRPGDPSGQISLRPGWYVAVAGALLMVLGAATRSSEHERARKPPGTI